VREVKKDSPPAPVANLIDKLVTYVNPKEGARRMMARQVMAISGGYHGGGKSRAPMRNFNPFGGSPEVDINLDLPELRPRSRDLARNAPPATAAIGVNVSSVVGTGLSMQPRIHRDVLKLEDTRAEAWEANTRRRFEVWASSHLCDAEMTSNFYELQAVAFRSMLESGDVFSMLPQIQRPGWPFRLAVQLLEADRVSNPDFRADTANIVGGIEVGHYGEPVFCHVSNRHPGSINRAGLTWKKVAFVGGKSGRRNVLHMFEVLRPNQKRGVPYLAPVIEQLKQLERYTDAELQAAVISAAFAVFIKMDPQAFQDLFEDDDTRNTFLQKGMQWDGSLDSGQAVNLLPGEEISAATPGRPNSEFDPFVTALFRQIGMALELPYEVLVHHFQSSYTAARAAMLSAWRVFRRRREFLSSKFCQPIYETWLAEEVAAGHIAAPGFFADPIVRAAWCGTKWTGDAPGVLDPMKEANAAEKRLDIGITTLDAESIAHDGEDWESKHKQQVKEKNMRRKDGLIDAPSAPAPAAPGESSAGNPDGGTTPPPPPSENNG